MPKFKNGLAKVGDYWHAKFEWRGKTIHRSTGHTDKAEAIAWLAELRAELRRADSVGTPEWNPTLNEVIEKWEAAQKKIGGRDKHIRTGLQMARLYFSDLLETKASWIDHSSAKKLISETISKASSATTESAFRYFKVFLNYAASEGWIKRPDWKTWREKHKVQVPKGRPKERTYVAKPNMDAFLAEIDKAKNPDVHLGIRLILGCGHREFEALWSDWSWVDWDAREILIRGKGNKDRRVPIPVWLYDYLLERKPDPCTGPMLSAHDEGYLSKASAKASKRAGIGTYHSHSLRRTYATTLKNNGMSVRDIQELLGHEDISTTQKYLGIDHEGKRKRVDEMYEGTSLGSSGKTLATQPVSEANKQEIADS